ncbi:MAG: glycerol-3-phosphate acyltransferase [Dehalococcoidales bacterium]
MTGLLIALALVAAYLLGAIPSAYIVGRLRKGTDIRQVGSRNMGAMNVFYSVGFGWGALVLAMDIGKGAAAMAIALALGIPEVARFAAGIVAVLGHGFPVFLRFQGGRGGATCIGVLSVAMPWGIPVFTGIFGLALLITRFPTLSYSLGLLSFPFVGWLRYDWQLAVFSVVLLLVPVIRYLPRIREMRAVAGNWGHVLRRRGLSDRF